MKFIRLISILLFSVAALAQNEDDALRYSETFFGGSARNTGMAGAMSAFGGDFSAVTQNPAGLGRLSKTNFSATLNIESIMTSADFYGNIRNERETATNFSNLSYVKVYDLTKSRFSNWYTVQLGMGLTRIKSFNQQMNYSGVADSSILHSFIREAEGTPASNIYDAHPFTSALAYEVFAIDPFLDSNMYTTYTTDFNSGQAVHNRSINREGGMTEYSFSLSGNYRNKFLLGGSINFTRVKYSESFSHQETFTDTSLWLQSINYTGYLDVEGWGYGLRVGAIYMPMDWLNIGLSAQLPTLYRLSDTWGNDMTSQTESGPYYTDQDLLPSGRYDYKITTPLRANLSLGVVLEEYGSIGAELEYVDYSAAKLSDRRFSDAPYSFNFENDQIDNIYRSAINGRIGAEVRLTPQFYLRGGFALYGSPYEADKGNVQKSTLFYTGGLGYNWGAVYADFSFVVRNTNETYYAYDPTITGSRADFDIRNAQFKLSMGLRF